MQGTTTAQGSQGNALDMYVRTYPANTSFYLADITRLPALQPFRFQFLGKDKERKKERKLIFDLPTPESYVLLHTNLDGHGFIGPERHEVRLANQIQVVLVGSAKIWQLQSVRWPNEGRPMGETPEWARFRYLLNERVELAVELGNDICLCPQHRDIRSISLVVVDDDLHWKCKDEACQFMFPIPKNLSKRVRKYTSPSFWKSMR